MEYIFGNSHINWKPSKILEILQFSPKNSRGEFVLAPERIPYSKEYWKELGKLECIIPGDHLTQ